jgi:hypothetical protein
MQSRHIQSVPINNIIEKFLELMFHWYDNAYS